MFKETRTKLTVFFGGLMFIFLIISNGVAYLVLSNVTYNEREKDIQYLADLETAEHAAELSGQYDSPSNKRTETDYEPEKKHDEGEGDEEESQSDDDYSAAKRIALRPFYFVLDEQGRLINGEFPQNLPKAEIIQYLQTWKPESDEVKYKSFKSRYNEDLHLLFAGRSVYIDEKFAGSIYTGSDISQQTDIFRNLFLILVLLSIVLLMISVLLGYVMSGKAMVPIIRSFKRQKQFVADASHELRTPLTVIQSSLEVVESEERDSMKPFSRQVLDDLKDEVKRLSSLVKNLLTLARADSEEIQLQFEVFSLHEELEKMMRKVQTLAAVKEQKVTLESTMNIIVRADRERLQQLILILLDNAIQYTPNKGSILLKSNSIGHSLAISISDTGIGIPKEKQKEIFERFYRDDPARYRGKGNVGLGLSIAKWIAETHGGTIQVESEPGRGSTFTAILPVMMKGLINK